MSARRRSAAERSQLHLTTHKTRGGGPGLHPTAQKTRGGGPGLAAALIFAALGDGIRLALVARLAASGPLSIVTLTDGTGITRQAVTKHLHVLSDAGLVRDFWVGRERVWELDTEPLSAARRSLDTIAAQWDDVLGRLKAFVESPR